MSELSKLSLLDTGSTIKIHMLVQEYTVLQMSHEEYGRFLGRRVDITRATLEIKLRNFDTGKVHRKVDIDVIAVSVPTIKLVRNQNRWLFNLIPRRCGTKSTY